MARRHEIETRLTAKDKTKAAFNRVQKRMKSLKKASLIAGGGVVAMAAGFAAAGKKAIDFADNIAKTSDRIGMTTKNFQEMAHSFDLAGVSTEQFSGAAAGLQKRIGDLNEDTGSLFTILKDDQAFATLLKGTTDTSEAIRIMVEKLSSTKNAMDRAALASAAFGRSAGSAIAKINLSELDAGIKTAREFGIAIDEDLLRNAEKMKDAFTTAMASFNSQFFSVMLETMSGMNLKEFANDMAKIAKWTVNAAIGLARFFGIIGKEKLTKLQQLQFELAGLELSIQRIKENARGGKGADGLGKYLLEKKQKVQELKKTIDEAIEAGKVLPPLEDFKFTPRREPLSMAPVHTVPQPTPAQIKKFQNLREKLDQYRESIKKTKVNLEQLNVQNFANVEAMEIEADRLNTTRAVQEALNAMRDKGLSISKAFEDATIAEANAVDVLNRKLKEKQDQLQPGPIQNYIDSTKDLKTSLEELAVQGVEGFNDSLAGMINGTVRAADAFKSMALSIIASMQKMIIKKLILDRVMGFIKTAIGSITAPTHPLNTGFETIDTLASGGPASAGRPYIIGERGPELMVPNRSGTVIPNHALGGGGAVINQTINIQTGVSQTVRAEILTLMPQINQATKAAVLDARQRGGSFANGFA